MMYKKRRPRWLQKLRARWGEYFWLPCPLCGEMFGGHEWRSEDTIWKPGENGHGVCVDCGERARQLSNPQCFVCGPVSPDGMKQVRPRAQYWHGIIHEMWFHVDCGTCTRHYYQKGRYLGMGSQQSNPLVDNYTRTVHIPGIGIYDGQSTGKLVGV